MNKYSFLYSKFFIFAPIWAFGKLVHKNRYAKFEKSSFGSARWNSL